MDPEKVIASGSQGFISDDPTKMAKQMLQTMHLFGKGYDFNERKYYHGKVSFDPADRPENGGVLTAESANRYAAKYAKKLWPNREVVWAVQDHGVSIHIHFIIAACEQTTGKKLDARDAEYRTWKDYANELAAEFGLSTLDWRKATKEKREREKNCEEIEHVTFSEIEMRRKNKAVWKDELRIFAGIYLHRFGGSEQFDVCIEDLRHRQETLRKEAQEFKTRSSQAVGVLKTKNLPLETYTDALALMQEMAEDIYISGPNALEYWAQQYTGRYLQRMPGTQNLEDLLKNSRLRTRQDETLYQIRPVDLTKL